MTSGELSLRVGTRRQGELGELGRGFEQDANLSGRAAAELDECRILWDHDILITPAIYPAVPATRNLVRFSITSANTDEEMDQAIRALAAVWEALHPAAADSPKETVETVPT